MFNNAMFMWFWTIFWPVNTSFLYALRGSFFFCLWAHTRICTETTWQWLRVARVVFPCRRPFYFRWALPTSFPGFSRQVGENPGNEVGALQESCNCYFRDISLKIYRIFTVLYAIIVPAKIIFFNNIIVIVFTESYQVTMIYCKRPIRFPWT